MHYTAQQIASIIEAKIHGEPLGAIQWLVTDTRKIIFPAESLFFALPGPHRNGHTYIQDAFRRGVRSFVVSAGLALPTLEAAVFFIVSNPLRALQQLATFHRKQFQIPVIGVTGSNGKTIVKEWLYQLIQPDITVLRSPKSYNSQLGVPLSVWQLEPIHQLAIFEAGISLPNEMVNLEAIIAPTIGIFTNLGAAHDEGFENRQQKLTEKWQLFRHCQLVIFNSDNAIIKEHASHSTVKWLDWGSSPTAFVQIVNSTTTLNGTDLQLIYAKRKLTLHLPFSDTAAIENAMHCITWCLYQQMPIYTLQVRLQNLQPLEMRLEWKTGIHGSLLLNDCYSHDLSSLQIALDYLQQQAGGRKCMAILSDMEESGLADAALYFRVASMLAAKGVTNLMAIGAKMVPYLAYFKDLNIQVLPFEHTNAFIETLDAHILKDAVVLVKGARSFGFEQIIAFLERQAHRTVLEINMQALGQNFGITKSVLSPTTKVMVMLKAFGYGSADAEIGRWLQFQQADYLAVAYADEGVNLRKGGVSLPIMVMNPAPSTFSLLDEYALEPALFSFEILNSFISFCSRRGVANVPVHIKLDTGMHRLGFSHTEIIDLTQILQESSFLKVQSVFTHLAASENPLADSLTTQQAQSFEASCNLLQQALGYSFLRHAANTAAIFRHPHLHYDMVRLGIGLFGTAKPYGIAKSLIPATAMYTTVAQLKKVAAGKTVGYGCHAVLLRDSVIATVRVGYADGYRRDLGNGVGCMFIHQQPALTVGNVCMDMTMLDVTDLSNVHPGDRVEVFGPNMPLAQLADLCGTIPYELMTGISQRVKRILVEE